MLDRKIKYPHDLDKDAKNLIDRLLDYVPENRIGMRADLGFDEIKMHPFFADIDFEALS